MKKVTRSLILLSAMTVLASVVESTPAVAATPTFFCEQHGQDLITNYGTSDNSNPVMLWNSVYFKRSGYSPGTRCLQVANRLQQYVEDETISNLTNGYINGMPVLCIGKKPNAHKCRPGADRGLVLTLRRQDNPAHKLKNLRNALSNTDARSVYVDGGATAKHIAEISYGYSHSPQAKQANIPPASSNSPQANIPPASSNSPQANIPPASSNSLQANTHPASSNPPQANTPPASSNSPQANANVPTVINTEEVLNNPKELNGVCRELQLPEVINLLEPIDNKLQTCIPMLKDVASSMKRFGDELKDNIGTFKVGNAGETLLKTLEYNPALDKVEIAIEITAKHNTDVPTYELKAGNTHYKKVCETGAVGALFQAYDWVASGGNNDNGHGCTLVADGFEPDVKILKGTRRITLYDATCEYAATVDTAPYVFHSGKVRCGKGLIGVTIDTKAIQDIVNGELPSLVDLVQIFDFKNPLVYGINEDTYDDKVKELKSKYPNALIYASSKNFVEHTSVKNAAIHTAAAIGTVGISAASLPVEFANLLKSETLIFGKWAEYHVSGISNAAFFNLLSSGIKPQSFTIPKYDVKIEVFNAPEIHQRCVAKLCSAKTELLRVGFAIIFQPTNGSDPVLAGW